MFLDIPVPVPTVYESAAHEFVLDWTHMTAVVAGKGPTVDVLSNGLKTQFANLSLSYTAKLCRIQTPVWLFVTSKVGDVDIHYHGDTFVVSNINPTEQYIVVVSKSGVLLYDYKFIKGKGIVSFNIYENDNVIESFQLLSGDGILENCPID